MPSFYSKGFIRKDIARKSTYVTISELITSRPSQGSVNKSIRFATIDNRIKHQVNIPLKIDWHLKYRREFLCIEPVLDPVQRVLILVAEQPLVTSKGLTVCMIAIAAQHSKYILQQNFVILEPELCCFETWSQPSFSTCYNVLTQSVHTILIFQPSREF